VHPYHTEDSPLYYSTYKYMRMLFDAVGPEQVSPHYESLSRSRRGVIFLYLYTSMIVNISLVGGWSMNEWIREMLFSQEFLIQLTLANTETRHFAFLPGPKFTIFYSTYIRYEYAQLISQWVDNVEQIQMKHLIPTKQQIEYIRINNEYDFIKKRALSNYLTNSRNEVERHFHVRAHNMLQSIERFEQSNLKTLLNNVTSSAVSKVNEALANPQEKERILQASFESALNGIRAGKMEYVNDPLLPILTEEISRRSKELKSLNAAEESKLLSLNADQKRIVAENDKKDKEAFLHQIPSISNPGIKMNPKFKAYAQ